MFTGIIQDIGNIVSIASIHHSLKITFATQLNIRNLELGFSIACNGCCLTVVEASECSNYNLFSVEVGPQTFHLTGFSKLKIDSQVNLEPALKVGDSMGGHQLLGHVDALCKISEFQKTKENFWKLVLVVPKDYSNFVLQKGSIALAGISLTIAQVSENNLGEALVEIMIIPHTYQNTTLKYYSEGTSIEVEFDQTIKAIASLLKTMLPNYIQARK